MKKMMFDLAANYDLDDKCSSNLTFITQAKYILPRDTISAQLSGTEFDLF